MGPHPRGPTILAEAATAHHQGAAEITVPTPSTAGKSACLLAE